MNPLLQKFDAHKLRISAFADFLLWCNTQSNCAVFNGRCNLLTNDDALKLAAAYFDFDLELIQKLQQEAKHDN